MDQNLALYQQLRESMSQEIADRTKIHQGKIARLKTAVAIRKAAGAPPPSSPLVMLAHGDSWFDYPLSGNSPSISHTDITVQLESMGTVNPHILNVSQWGDATTAEMSRPKQELMIAALQDPTNWMDSSKPDAILFSGGGNDIAGDQFCIFLDYAAPSVTGLDAVRFQEALGMVEAASVSRALLGRCFFSPINACDLC